MFKRAIAVGATAAALAVGALVVAPAATAAPVTCPGNQTAEKVGPGEWACVNSGGNTSGSGWHKGNGNKI